MWRAERPEGRPALNQPLYTSRDSCKTFCSVSNLRVVGSGMKHCDQSRRVHSDSVNSGPDQMDAHSASACRCVHTDIKTNAAGVPYNMADAEKGQVPGERTLHGHYAVIRAWETGRYARWSELSTEWKRGNERGGGATNAEACDYKGKVHVMILLG
ncbi:hypothetical protein BD309DRAFT_947371 [Dichomitus squalens]|nr:hypothetical protein BD309DRAFT_947371 [Dichomitus squalens]